MLEKGVAAYSRGRRSLSQGVNLRLNDREALGRWLDSQALALNASQTGCLWRRTNRDRAGCLDVSAACIVSAVVLFGVEALLNSVSIHDNAS